MTMMVMKDSTAACEDAVAKTTRWAFQMIPNKLSQYSETSWIHKLLQVTEIVQKLPKTVLNSASHCALQCLQKAFCSPMILLLPWFRILCVGPVNNSNAYCIVWYVASCYFLLSMTHPAAFSTASFCTPAYSVRHVFMQPHWLACAPTDAFW